MKSITPKQFRTIVERWFKNHQIRIALADSATDAQVSKLVQGLPFQLDKKVLLFVKEFGGKIFRGYPPDTLFPANFSPSFSLGTFFPIPIRDILPIYKENLKLLKIETHLREMKIKAAKGVEPVWFSENWLPFADNGGGDLFCIDMSKKTTKCPVVLFAHEYPLRPKLADSIEEFYAKVAEGYKKDLFYLREESAAVYKMREKDFPRPYY